MERGREEVCFWCWQRIAALLTASAALAALINDILR
jgi:hypothetical protein